MTTPSPLTRRGFLQAAGTCAAHLALMASPFPLSARDRWSRRARAEIVAQESFGRVERMEEGLYALISTPLTGDYTTVSNGGIIAGQEGVLMVEAFQTAEGAEWLARQARDLTGRWPTHVLVTHYHGDHSQGVEGYLRPPDEGAPKLHVTTVTRDLTVERLPEDAGENLRGLWADVVLLDSQELHDLELGGRSVRLVPRRGHTASDVTVELPENGLTWCGDLVWNGMFPNYMDAIPSELSGAVRSIRAGGSTTWIPGHGPLAGAEDMSRYVAVIDGIEETARWAIRGGWTAEEAGARHTIPAELGEWTLFNPSYFQRAIEAWMKELG